MAMLSNVAHKAAKLEFELLCNYDMPNNCYKNNLTYICWFIISCACVLIRLSAPDEDALAQA